MITSFDAPKIAQIGRGAALILPVGPGQKPLMRVRAKSLDAPMISLRKGPIIATLFEILDSTCPKLE